MKATVMNIFRAAIDVVGFIVPQFVTEDVIVARRCNGDLFTLCPVGQEVPSDDIAGVIKVRSFSCFGVGWCPRAVGEMRPYDGA